MTSSQAPQRNMKAQVPHWNWWEGNGDFISCQPWATATLGQSHHMDLSSLEMLFLPPFTEYLHKDLW